MSLGRLSFEQVANRAAASGAAMESCNPRRI